MSTPPPAPPPNRQPLEISVEGERWTIIVPAYHEPALPLVLRAAEVFAWAVLPFVMFFLWESVIARRVLKGYTESIPDLIVIGGFAVFYLACFIWRVSLRVTRFIRDRRREVLILSPGELMVRRNDDEALSFTASDAKLSMHVASPELTGGLVLRSGSTRRRIATSRSSSECQWLRRLIEQGLYGGSYRRNSEQ